MRGFVGKFAEVTGFWGDATPAQPNMTGIAVMYRATLDGQRLLCYVGGVEIESIKHKGLRRFFETGNAKGLVGDVARLRNMLAFIDAAETMQELAVPPNFGFHALVGDRKGDWSMTVTKNWRLTFRLNADGALINMDLEDYHGA